MSVEKSSLDITPQLATHEAMSLLIDRVNATYDTLTPEQKKQSKLSDLYLQTLNASTVFFNTIDTVTDTQAIEALKISLTEHATSFLAAAKNEEHDYTEDTSAESISDPRTPHEIRGLYTENRNWRPAVSYSPIGDVYPPKPIEVLQADVTAMFEAIPNLDVDKYLGVDTQFKQLIGILRRAEASKNQARIDKAQELWVRQIDGLLKDAQAKAGLYEIDAETRDTIRWENTVAASGLESLEQEDEAIAKEREPKAEEIQVTEVTLEHSSTLEEKLEVLETRTRNLSDFAGQYLSVLGKNPELLDRINKTIAQTESFLDGHYTSDEATLSARLNLVDKVTRELLHAVSAVEVHTVPAGAVPDASMSAEQPNTAQESESPHKEQTPAQRQQNKIIKTIVSGNPNLLNEPEVTVSEAERNAFFEKVRTGEIHEEVLDTRIIKEIQAPFNTPEGVTAILDEVRYDQTALKNFIARCPTPYTLDTTFSNEPTVLSLFDPARRALFYGKRQEYWNQCLALLTEARTAQSESQSPIVEEPLFRGSPEEVVGTASQDDKSYPESQPLTSSPSPIDTTEIHTTQAQREGPSESYLAWREANKEHKASEKAYQNAYNAYLTDTSLTAKARGAVNWTKSLFGLKPTLPKELQTLRQSADDARRAYVPLLQKQLQERMIARGKKVTTESILTTNESFGKHFILRRHEKGLKVQKESLDAQKQSVIKNTLFALAKNKYITRGTVLALAAVSGGIGGLAFTGARMATSAIAGGALAREVFKAREGLVQEADIKAGRASYNASAGFSIELMDALEQDLEAARDDLAAQKRRQKAAAVLAAAAVGGATGAGLNALDSYHDALTAANNTVPEVSSNTPTSEPNPETSPSTETLTSEESPTESIYTPELYTVVRGDTLWNLIEEQYTDELAELPPQIRNQVIETVLDRIQADPNLRESINPDLTDVDMIRIGQELDLSSMHDTIEQVIDEKTHANTITTGSLSIESISDVEAETVPIEVRPNPTTPLTTFTETHKYEVTGNNGYVPRPLGTIESFTLSTGNNSSVYTFGDISLITSSDTTSILESAVKPALPEILQRIISEHPQATQAEWESLAAQKLSERFGKYEWWNEAGVVGLYLGDLVIHTPDITPEEITELADPKIHETGVDLSEGLAAAQPTFEVPTINAIKEFTNYITETYGNQKTFERVVSAAANRLETAHQSSLFGMPLGQVYTSPLQAFDKMPLSEYQKLMNSGSNGIRAFANENNIRYEAIVGTKDGRGLEEIIDSHQQDYLPLTVGQLKTTTVGDVFRHYVATQDAAERAAKVQLA